ncbi:MAG: lasso peptide biosynthesis PqqD family chaperone [Bacillota bacterium]|uniref:Lasso peptide biosynthesis PqqD family chaperone n=1 Tax=Virgibacillus salarius TaxID=447199 RepID=A0A941E1Y5_9BACI|nr:MULTISPECIES: lasso peptide biosynthesis PqqD family chaperone [Bacillaceae]MBR7797408.1 lasso peptide biosynthesis PqqD family chaperone [Virgibacillus salarius]NAZ10118.1 lasso peptide biosynthesis PqqD family chaperone [Agaribacter marinus]WBX81429.1 lasso peptide biosynthesis PqqD family chaperone [Virgibacillus salarius]
MIKQQKLIIHQLVSQDTNAIVSDMDGEKVMLCMENSSYYNLGTVGGDIWEHIEKPISIKALISLLTSQYDVEEHVCEEQVLTFLGHLLNEGLIQVNPESLS